VIQYLKCACVVYITEKKPFLRRSKTTFKVRNMQNHHSFPTLLSPTSTAHSRKSALHSARTSGRSASAPAGPGPSSVPSGRAAIATPSMSSSPRPSPSRRHTSNAIPRRAQALARVWARWRQRRCSRRPCWTNPSPWTVNPSSLADTPWNMRAVLRAKGSLLQFMKEDPNTFVFSIYALHHGTGVAARGAEHIEREGKGFLFLCTLSKPLARPEI